MAEERSTSLEFFPSLKNPDEFYENLIREENKSGRILNMYLRLNLLSLLYGIIMGSYHGATQAVATGVKIPVLFSLALLICFPAFYIIQSILGSKLRLFQMITIILSGFLLTAAIMVSFIPVVIFFQLTGGNYYFLILLHIAVMVLSGIFGMRNIIGALKYSCEKKNVYPQIGVTVFRFWVVILAFVGIQLAWNLRPFLGDRGRPFKLFRSYEGNFYTAVIYSFRQLTDTGDSQSATGETGLYHQFGKRDILPFQAEKKNEDSTGEE